MKYKKFYIMKYGNAQESIMCEIMGKLEVEIKEIESKFNDKWKVLNKPNTGDKELKK